MEKRNSTFGLTKFKKCPQRSALLFAILAGLLIGVVLAVTFSSLSNAELDKWKVFLIFFCVMSPVTIALVWALVVYRDTIPGAVKRPDQSVESDWVRRAAEATFFLGTGLCGIGTAVAGLVGYATVSSVLTCVMIFLLGIFALSYFIIRRRG